MSIALSLRLSLLGRAARFRLTQIRPSGAPSIWVEGPDPLRVLVTGAGLASGYGVRSWGETMAGTLARHLHRTTSRGVRLDIRAAATLPARNAVTWLGPNGAHTYEAVVFAPCYLEASISPDAGMTRHAGAIQQHLIQTGGAPLRQVLMLGVPRPSQFSWLNLAVAEAATTTNRAMRNHAAGIDRVSFWEPAPFRSFETETPFDTQYYADLGHGVAAALSPRLERSDQLQAPTAP